MCERASRSASVVALVVESHEAQEIADKDDQIRTGMHEKDHSDDNDVAISLESTRRTAARFRFVLIVLYPDLPAPSYRKYEDSHCGRLCNQGF